MGAPPVGVLFLTGVGAGAPSVGVSDTFKPELSALAVILALLIASTFFCFSSVSPHPGKTPAIIPNGIKQHNLRARRPFRFQ